MYSLINIGNNKFEIKVGEFIIGECFRGDDGTWHSTVLNDIGLVGLRYCAMNRKKSVEGLLKQMIYKAYNEILHN